MGKFKKPKLVFNKTKEELILNGIKEKDAEIITDKKYKENLDKYIEYMHKNKIQLITINDEDYPQNLKLIYDAPAVLYIKGNKKILNKKYIAMVECRLCTNYGANIEKKISYELSLNSINIISGLARGIDTYSHIIEP